MKRILSMSSLALGLTLLGAAAGPSLASPGDALEGGGVQRPAAGDRADGQGLLGRRPGRRARHERRRAARLLRALRLTDAQKSEWRASREAAAPVREDLRSK